MTNNDDPVASLRADLNDLMDLVQDLRIRLEKLETSPSTSSTARREAHQAMRIRVMGLLKSTSQIKWTRAAIGQNLIDTTVGGEYALIRRILDSLVNEMGYVRIVGGTKSEPQYQWVGRDRAED